MTQQPDPAPSTTPYRPNPHAGGPSPTGPRRIRWQRGAIAAAIALVAGATLIPRFTKRKRPTGDDVPSELLNTPAEFPYQWSELPPATPLSPLIAADQPDHLAVLEPNEGATRVARRHPLVIRFNRPMVRPVQVGRPLPQSPLRFSPAIRGQARWTTRSTLTFDAEPATWNTPVETTLTFNPELRSLSDEALDEETQRTVVFAGGTRLYYDYSASRRVLPGEPLTLTFDGPVDPGVGAQMLVYEIGGGQRYVPFTTAAGGADAQGRNRINVLLSRSLDPGSRVAVALAPSLYAAWEGSENPGVVTFDFAPRPKIEGIACPEQTSDASSCQYQGPPQRIVDIDDSLRLFATNNIATPLAPGAVTVTPTVTALAVTVNGHTIELKGEWEPGQVYEVRFGEIRDTEGHVLGGTSPLAVRSAGKTPEVQTATGSFAFERSDSADMPFAAVHAENGAVNYAPVGPGQEFIAALRNGRPTNSSDALAWSRTPIGPLTPGMRANHWARGRYAWRDGSRNASMALVSFDPNTGDEDGATPSLYQSTDLGVSAMGLQDGMVVWVTSIQTAQPVANAQITIADHDAREIGTGRTDAAGMAWIRLPRSGVSERLAVRAVNGDDRAVLVVDPPNAMRPTGLGLSDDVASRQANAPVASVWADRGAYRPGESLRAKAVVRTIHGDALEAVRRGNVRFVLYGPNGEMAWKRARLSTFGTADVEFTVDRNAPLGEYNVMVYRDGFSGTIGQANLRVGEFRQPNVRVDLRLAEGDISEGDTMRATAEGRYLFGAPVGNTPARWTLTREGGASMPTRWEQFTFTGVDAVSRSGTVDTGEVTLNAEGAAQVSARMALSSTQRERATLEVTVRDSSGQETSAWRTFTTYPGDYEVGVRNGSNWVEGGAPLDLDAVVVDHAGNPVAGRTVQARILREGWHTYWEWSEHGADDEAGEAGAYQSRRTQERAVVHECTLTSGNEPVRCAWVPTQPGTYVLEATVTDARNRRSVASRRLYVAAPGEHPDRDPPGAPIQITPSQRDWFVGDRARIAFECPWPEAEALVTVAREGRLHTERRRVQAGGVVMELPVTADMVPNAYVTVSLVKPRSGDLRRTGEFDLSAPDLRWGATEIRVRPQTAPMRVDLHVGAETVLPGTDVPIDVTVDDGNGHPLQAEVALYAVDEGTLRLTSYNTPDPTSGLLPRHAPVFAMEDLRRQLVTRVNFPALPGASGDGSEADSRAEMRDDREVFDPTPLWMPHLVTDAQGRVHATLHVPSRNTQYRVMAVAIDTGMRSGRAFTNITAKRPVVLRPSFPRTLTEGDRFEAAVFLHNTEESAVDATVTPVVVDARGETHREASRTVHLEPRAEMRVGHMVEATGDHVEVKFEVTANNASDTASARIPVQPRVRWSRAGTVGAVRGERSLTLALPPGSSAGRDDVTLLLATHPFVGIDGAMADLDDTWYGGTEPLSAALLGWTSLASLDAGLRPARWSRAEVRRRGEQTLVHLAEIQNSSGGFATWSAEGEPYPYLTAYALHAIVAAHRLGWNVPEGMRERAISWLASAVDRGAFYDSSMGWYDELAFALRVLSEARRPNSARMTSLYEQREQLSPYGLAQLALAMDSTDRRRDTLLASAQRRAGAMSTNSGRDATGVRWFMSDARTTGAVLEASALIDTNTDASRNLAAQLFRQRVGHGGASWGSTHATSYALQALAAYARRFEEGRELDATVAIDNETLRPTMLTRQGALYTLPARVAAGSHTLRLRASGPTFYALDARWSTPLGESESVARGRDVALHRVFETEAGATIEGNEPHVHLGDLLRVRVFVYSEANTPPFVVVRDPLGGGFEAVDAGFATTPRASLDALLGGGADDGAIDPRGFYAARSIDQITHRGFRTGVTTFHLDHGSSGLREFTYAVRATTVGRFTVPPAQLEALYQPGVMARSTMNTFVVEP